MQTQVRERGERGIVLLIEAMKLPEVVRRLNLKLVFVQVNVFGPGAKMRAAFETYGMSWPRVEEIKRVYYEVLSSATVRLLSLGVA